MSRQGLKRLECEAACGCLAYMTLAQLEKHGLPACPCGSRLVPESLEVAAHVMGAAVEQLPAWHEYVQTASSVMHGQAPSARNGRAIAKRIAEGRELASPDAVAATRIEKSRRQEAHARRLSGLVQFQAAAQVAAEIPF